MIARILSVIILSGLSLCSYGQCEQRIKDFYVRYMQELEKPEKSAVLDSLCYAVIAPEMWSRFGEYAEKTGCDPMTRAQDVSQYGMDSLSVSSLGDGWYMVRYKWSEGSDYTEIPLKASCNDGEFRITYITPLWLGTQYGDHLLDK